MLRKGINSSFKDVDLKRRTVTGYLSHFGSRDYDGDIIEKGAYSKTIQERGPRGAKLIKFLLDHDKKKAIGVFTELKEDSTGLYYEAKVGTHNAGEDFVKMVESEIINQHSIGFNIINEHQKGNDNHITEVRLMEGSALQFLGANPNTPITGLKSIEETEDELHILEKAIRHGTLTDRAYKKIENRIKSLYDALRPSPDTVAADEELKKLIKESFSIN